MTSLETASRAMTQLPPLAKAVGNDGVTDDAMCEEEVTSGQGHRLELVVLLAAYSVSGFVGNLVILLVYGRSKSRLSHATYVYTLSIIDFTICCVIIPYTVAYERRLVTSDVICRGLELLRHILVKLSNFMLVVIAVERHFSVFRPWRPSTKAKARKEIIVVLIYSVITSVPAVTIFSVTVPPDAYAAHRSAVSVTSAYAQDSSTETSNTFSRATSAQNSDFASNNLTEYDDVLVSTPADDALSSITAIRDVTTFSTANDGSTVRSTDVSGLTQHGTLLAQNFDSSMAIQFATNSTPMTAEAGSSSSTACPRRAYCQFTREVFGATWAFLYQTFMALEYFVLVFVLLVLYGRVYRKIWLRALLRRKMTVDGKVATGQKPKLAWSTQMSKEYPLSVDARRTERSGQKRGSVQEQGEVERDRASNKEALCNGIGAHQGSGRENINDSCERVPSRLAETMRSELHTQTSNKELPKIRTWTENSQQICWECSDKTSLSERESERKEGAKLAASSATSEIAMMVEDVETRDVPDPVKEIRLLKTRNGAESIVRLPLQISFLETDRISSVENVIGVVTTNHNVRSTFTSLSSPKEVKTTRKGDDGQGNLSENQEVEERSREKKKTRITRSDTNDRGVHIVLQSASFYGQLLHCTTTTTTTNNNNDDDFTDKTARSFVVRDEVAANSSKDNIYNMVDGQISRVPTKDPIFDNSKRVSRQSERDASKETPTKKKDRAVGWPRLDVPRVAAPNSAAYGCADPSRAQQRDNRKKAATMLFVATLICVLSWLPFWVDVFGLTDSLAFRYTFLLGHVTNPLVYGLMNVKVREEIRKRFLCR